MNNYDPNRSPAEYLKNINVSMTQHEFDTFLVGKYHSKARLIRDLLVKKKEIKDSYVFGQDIISQADQDMIRMIDAELDKHDINLINNLEKEEPIFWINELARQSALEINTYGRIRPETMDKLMLIETEHFEAAMAKCGALVMRLKQIADSAYSHSAPLPESMPRT